MGAGDDATIKVLICDSVPMVRGGLAGVLNAEPDIEVVGATGDGAEAVDLAYRLRPDVVILDLDLATLSGFEVALAIRRLTFVPAPEILVFTADTDDASIMRALEAGVYGFVIKEADTAELLRAVRALALGGAAASSQVLRRLIDWLFWREAQPITTARKVLETLTLREREILRLVADGMTDTDIAKELSVQVATVRSHTYHLRQKLDLSDRAQLVTFAYQSGFSVPRVPEIGGEEMLT
jgi:DNA-binding NarL/FixJ family response regulator